MMGLESRPGLLRGLVILHGSDIEQILRNRISLDLPNQAGQDMEAQIQREGRQNGVQQSGPANITPEKAQLLRARASPLTREW